MAADTPESLLDSRSEFDRAKTLLGRVLRDHAASVRALTEGVLSIYGSRAFIAGWSITLARGEVEESFHVLVDEEFPYSKIRVAYKTRDMYLTWPHVEGAGLLCLPEHSPPSLDIEQAAVDALSDSLILVEHCQNPDFVAQELGREFRSYWKVGRYIGGRSRLLSRRAAGGRAGNHHAAGPRSPAQPGCPLRWSQRTCDGHLIVYVPFQISRFRLGAAWVCARAVGDQCA